MAEKKLKRNSVTSRNIKSGVNAKARKATHDKPEAGHPGHAGESHSEAGHSGHAGESHCFNKMKSGCCFANLFHHKPFSFAVLASAVVAFSIGDFVFGLILALFFFCKSGKKVARDYYKFFILIAVLFLLLGLVVDSILIFVLLLVAYSCCGSSCSTRCVSEIDVACEVIEKDEKHLKVRKSSAGKSRAKKK